MPQPKPLMALNKWVNDNRVTLLLTFFVFLTVAVYMSTFIFISIYPGQAGVLWSRFGDGTLTRQADGTDFIGRIGADNMGAPEKLNKNHELKGKLGRLPYREGLRVKYPWDKIYIYNIRLQEHVHVYNQVLDKDGLDMQVAISIRWKPIESDLGKLHQDIGPDYLKTLIIPIVESHAREEIGQFSAEELYTSKRSEIQKSVLGKVKMEIKTGFHPEDNRESYIIIENILIRSVELPELVRTAIQQKIEQKHLADSYVYRLDRERQEADRKAIEAAGIRRFQEAINGSISERYLKWKGIDATLELARSNNAKIVVIGASKDGLPIILGGLNQSSEDKSTNSSKPDQQLPSNSKSTGNAGQRVSPTTEIEPAPPPK